MSGVTYRTDVVVIGAGQAGLSSAYHLRRAGFAPITDPGVIPAPDAGYVVLDANSAPGGAWQHRWPTLRMRTVHGIFDLPGMHFDPPAPTERASDAVPRYFAAYEREFALPVRRPVQVRAVRRGPDDRLLVETVETFETDGPTGVTWSARAVINATGTWTRPFWPYYPGRETFRGRQLHAADYRGPAELAGRRVVVVGGGASAVQILVELAEVADTVWVTRRPPVFRDGPFTEEVGREVVAQVDARVRAGLPPISVVGVTGLALTPTVLQARRRGVLERLPIFDRITPDGVAWADGRFAAADVILWATGWRAALDHLAPLRLRGPGGGIVMDGTRVVAQPRLHLVGYGPSASTVGANRAGRTAVREIRALLDGDRLPTGTAEEPTAVPGVPVAV